MQQRPFGPTGHQSSIVILGTAAFWRADQALADTTLSQAQAAGINHIDVAPQYGNAQKLVGPWLESRRDHFFLNCKTLEREAEAAWADLQNSLELLRTGVIDLYQFHALTTFDDLAAVSKQGGAIESFRRARDEGLVRFLGVTAHGMLAPAIVTEAVERFDLEAVMVPLNPRLWSEADYRRDTERMLTLAGERNVAVQIIKSAARRPWGDREKTLEPWYEPYTTLEEIEPSVRFVLSQPNVTAVVSAGDARLLPVFIKAAEDFEPMSEDEQQAIVEERASDDLIFDGPRPLSAG